MDDAGRRYGLLDAVGAHQGGLFKEDEQGGGPCPPYLAHPVYCSDPAPKLILQPGVEIGLGLSIMALEVSDL